MTITLHDGDLPADLDLGAVVAVDSETMGLRPNATVCAWSNCHLGTAPPIWCGLKRGAMRHLISPRF